jgi:OmpA-OmpF porin, OOP family
MMITKRAAALVAGLLLAAAMQAQANSGIYLSAAGGLSKLDDDCEGVDRCDNTGTAFRLAGGYRFNSHFGIEAAYLDFGKFTSSSDVPGFGRIEGEVKLNGPGLALVLFAPVMPQLDLQARLGVANTKVKLRGRLNNDPWVEVGSESNAAFWGGLGLSYAFTPTLAGSVQWDGTQGEFEGEKVRVNAFTIGLTLRF